MEINFQKQRKKNHNTINSFNITNATKTFKKLLEKNRKDEQFRNKKIYYHKTDELFDSLNNVFFKEEIKETDFDYIFREIKNQIKINQTLVDLYGINAPKKILPYTREPIRFDKKLLFNPLKNNDNNHIRYASFNSKNKEERFLNLPRILKNKIRILNDRENSEKIILNKKLESNKDVIKENKSEIKFNNIKIERSYFNDVNNTFNNENAPIKSYNFFSKTNNNILNLNNNNANNNSTFTGANKSSLTFGNKSSFTVGNRSNYSFDRSEYLLTLDNLKGQLRHNQRRQKLYFNSNDYGCELSKNKYNYITKKFFN